MSTTVLREIRLYGSLGCEFGRVFRLAVATPAEAVRALMAVLPGFERAFLGRDGRQAYHVFVGRGDLRRDVGKDELGEPLGAADPIRFVPVIAGAKRGGVLQTVLGAVLVVAGLVLSYYTGSDFGLISMGVSMIVGGVIQMLSPQRKGKDPTSNLPSYIFNGPVNNIEQGGPVPVRYGRALVGSTVVSQGISTNHLAGPAGVAPPSNLTKLPAYEPHDPREDRIPS